jgi:hypothetical protein
MSQGRLEKFLSPSRCESDSLTVPGERVMGQKSFFDFERRLEVIRDDQGDRAMGGFPR